MRSPITGKEMKLTKEKRSMTFRKEKFEIVFHYFKCEESGEQFTTTEMDEVNMNQVYNQYRDLHHIPFPAEITRIREKYDLSAAKMAGVLSFGANNYRLYEAGEIPSVSNAKLIRLADEPDNFMKMVEECEELKEKDKQKLIVKAKQLKEERWKDSLDFDVRNYLLGQHRANVYSGYKNPDMSKFTEMVVFFADQLKPFKTKMNKLLFFADFLMFKETGFSISGVRYKAIDMGPVPNNFQSIFEYLANHDEIDVFSTPFSNGIGEQFIARKDRRFNKEVFSEKEFDVLKTVAKKFKMTSTTDIIQLSHLEEGWKKNQKEKSEISYQYAFELTQI